MAPNILWREVRRLVWPSPKRTRGLTLVAITFFLSVFSLQMLMGRDGTRLLDLRAPLLKLNSRVSIWRTTAPLLHLKARVDNATQDMLQDVVARVYNLPGRYGLEEPPPLKGVADNKCGRYPSLVDLSFNNVYWQVLHSSNGTFYLYNAFFDNRTRTTPGTSVRILGMADRITPAVTTHCQLWYEGEAAPVVAKVVEYRYMWIPAFGNYKNGILQPYLLQCVVPPSHRQRVPQSVSLVERACDMSTNNLRVVHDLPPAGGGKKDFAVCVKGMVFHDDKTLRIVEWLELLFLLGADKVILYDLGVHRNMSRVLRHYESQGRVSVRKLTLPGEQPNARGLVMPYLRAKVLNQWQNELIPYNDCFYRNINLYKLVVLLDIDEVIMPRTARSWKELLQQLAPEALSGKGQPWSSYYAENVYFLDGMQEPHGWAPDVPRFMHMLQHVYRAANYTGPGGYVKAFHDTQRVLTLHNHFPFSCLKGGCQHFPIPKEVAHLQHYRVQCVGELLSVCPYYRNHTVLDDAILKYKKPLLDNALRTLRYLGFLQEGPGEPPEGR